jgi:hypothetical protein
MGTRHLYWILTSLSFAVQSDSSHSAACVQGVPANEEILTYKRRNMVGGPSHRDKELENHRALKVENSVCAV